MNQFVDGAVVLVTTPHQVGFLMAEKSFNKRVVGDFAKAVGSFPVTRPQDLAIKGIGTINMDGMKVHGRDTKFLSSLEIGDKIRAGDKSVDAYKIKEVISETELLLGEDVGEASPMLDKCQGKDNWVVYDILAFVDQSKMFAAVQDGMRKGKNICIFPEGGSHDNTDLLPLKGGVCAIAFSTLDKYDVNVPIVPIGLNYFRPGRFRGRVVVEYGEPINIDKALVQTYKQSKRAGYSALLSKVEDGMRSVIVTAKSYP